LMSAPFAAFALFARGIKWSRFQAGHDGGHRSDTPYHPDVIFDRTRDET
jgi:hypothetical protein